MASETNRKTILRVGLQSCLNRTQNLLEIFKGESNQDVFSQIFEDTSDFVTNLKIVQAVLDRLLKEELPEESSGPELVQTILVNLTQFENKLVSLKKKGRIVRFFTNKRLRRQLDQLNSSLGLQIAELEQEFKRNKSFISNIRIQGYQNFLKSTQRRMLNFSNPNSSDSSVLKAQQTVEDRLKVLDEIWTDLFGDKYVVSWDEFAVGLRTKVNFSKYGESVLREIIDSSNTNVVPQYKFLEFLRGFGPIEKCVENAIRIYNEPWFHGYLSKEEARKFLEMQELGTFLVRFSSSQSGCFAISYVGVDPNESSQEDYNDMPSVKQMEQLKLYESRKVLTVLVDSVYGIFKIRENRQRKEYKSLHSVIHYYGAVLTRPFTSTLPREPWFFGDISADEAHELLEGEKPGTFLIRFSSKPECFASSFVGPDGKVGKSLISKVGKGYLVEQSADLRRYKTVQDLVVAYQNLGVFRYPYEGKGQKPRPAPKRNNDYHPFPTQWD